MGSKITGMTAEIKLLAWAVCTLLTINLAAAEAPRCLPDSEPFVIGVYSADPWNDATMQTLRDAGVNYVHSYSMWRDKDPIPKMDMAHKYGMKVMYDIGGLALTSRPATRAADWRERISKNLSKVAGHPALGMVYLWDEPYNQHMDKLAELRKIAAEKVKQPNALVIHWRTNWENTRNKSDIWMVDWYPIRGHKFPEESPLTQMNDFVAVAARMRMPESQFIPVLQMNDFSCFKKDVPLEMRDRLRYPNLTEMRHMIIGSLTFGVRGLFFFSYYHAHMDRPEGRAYFNEVFKVLTAEVRALEKALPKLWEPSGWCYDFNKNNQVQLAYFKRVSGDFILLNNSSNQARKLKLPMRAIPQAPLQGKLVPFGLTSGKKAVISQGMLEVEAAPWESFIWQVK